MLDDCGRMLGLDAGFCAIMRADAGAMVGRGVLDVTVPDDREPCRAAMVRLRETGLPFVAEKRMQRGDGTVVWVEQVTTRVEFADAPPAIVATFREIQRPSDRIDYAALLGQARFLRDSGADRRAMLGSVFANVPWDLLLKAYIAEAEGRTVSIAEMARTAQITPVVAERWALALTSQGLFEIEAGDGAAAPRLYRLTADAHARLEAYLSERLAKLIGVGVLA